MKILFENLFDAEIQNSFYNDGVSRDFQIAPSQNTAATIQKLGLKFRQTQKGISVFYEADTTNPAGDRPLKNLKDAKLNFLLLRKTNNLENYSDLPLENPINKIYYFSNLIDNKQDGDLLLSGDSTSPYINSSDSFQLKGSAFSFRYPSPNNTATVKVKNQSGNTIYEKVVNVVGGYINYNVNIANDGPGVYSIEVSGTEVSRFYSSDEAVRKNAFGVIEIFINTTTPLNYRLLTIAGKVKSKLYKLKINNRKTFWKYFVILNYDTSITPNKLSISSQPPGITFTRQSSITNNNGKFTIPFISDTALDIKEKMNNGLQLKRSTTSGDTILLDGLPNASSDSIKPNASDNKVYSEIYIYV